MSDSLGGFALAGRGTKRSAAALAQDGSSEPNKEVDNVGGPKSEFLACPFYKKDPIRYQSCLFRNTLSSTSYVKQHLSRSHQSPEYCYRCGKTLGSHVGNGNSLMEHLRRDNCSFQSFESPEGLTASQLEALRVRRGGTWFDIWKVSFPDIPPPASPYVARAPSAELLDVFRGFMMSRGRFLERLRSRLADLQTESSISTIALGIMTELETIIAEFQNLDSLPLHHAASAMPTIVFHPEDLGSHAHSAQHKRQFGTPRLPTPSRSVATLDSQPPAPPRNEGASTADSTLEVDRGRMLSPETDASRPTLALPNPKGNSTSTHACEFCDKPFASQKDLNRHISGVHDNRRYQCQYCGYTSGRKDNLNRHFEKMHKGTSSPSHTEAPLSAKHLSHALSTTSSSSENRVPLASHSSDDVLMVDGGKLAPELMSSLVGTRRHSGWAKLEAPKPTPARKRMETTVDLNSPIGDSSLLNPATVRWHRFAKKSHQVYNYDDCHLLPEQIRLLLLRPNVDKAADLVVELRAISVQELAGDPDLYPYTALSYDWGTEEASMFVYVDPCTLDESSIQDTNMEEVASQVANWKRLPIQPNLDAALRQLRQKAEPTALWVDAICINQGSTDERSHHVTLMHKIYSNASMVLAWLGQADEERVSDRAMEFIGTIIEQDSLAEYLQPKYADSWASLLELQQRPWFSRAWIIQEVAVARNMVLRCGSAQKHWRDFSDAVSLFSLNFETILSLIKTGSGLQSRLEGIYDWTSVGAMRFVDLISDIFIYRPDGRTYKPRHPLETLVCTSPTFEFSDPRDRVYALLGLSRNAEDIQLDYSLAPVEVYINFVESVVAKSRSLDVICRPWAPSLLSKELNSLYPASPALPSWIPKWDGLTKDVHGKMARESFVGLPGKGFYDSSGQTEPKAKFSKSKNPRDARFDPVTSNLEGRRSMLPESWQKPPQALSRDSLAAYGIFLGQVTWQEKIVNGVISSRVLARLGHDLHAEELDQVSPSLWRTLVADRDPDGRNPPAWYHRACLMCLAADVKLGKLDTKEIIARDGNSMKARYLRRVQDVCWGRTYFECQMGSDESGGQKLHGIGPADVQKNDTVCVLFGCSTPVVLRPMWTGEGDYTVVGPAFVLGMMDGEALENLKPDERKFTLY